MINDGNNERKAEQAGQARYGRLSSASLIGKSDEWIFGVKLFWIISYLICRPILWLKRINISVNNSILSYPANGGKSPLIIISNHKSIYDPWIVCNSIPFKTFLKILPIRIMGATNFVESLAAKLDKIGLVKFIYKIYGVVPFRHEWTFEQKLEPLIDCLKKRETIMIFPEGKINKKPGVEIFRRGIIHICKQINADVMPMAILSAREYGRKRTSVHIGETFNVPREVLNGDDPNDPYNTKSCNFVRSKVTELFDQNFL